MERKPLGFMQLAIVVGFSLFYAEYLISFFGVFLYFPHGYDFTAQHACQVVYFASSLVGAGAALALFRRKETADLDAPRWLEPALAVLGVPLPVCAIADALGAVLPLAAVCAACFCAGVCISIGFVKWDDLAKRGYLKHNVFGHGIIFAAGGALFVAVMAPLSQLLVGCVCLVFLLASTFLLAFTGGRAEQTPDGPIEPSIEFFRKTRHIDFATNVLTIAFGFAFVLLYRYLGDWFLPVMGTAVLIDLAFTLAVGKTRIVPFMGTMRMTMALVSLACIALSLPSASAKGVALAGIIAIWFVYRTVNAGSLMELAASRGLSLQYTVGRGKLASNVGFCLGLVLGLVVTWLDVAEAVVPYVALAIVALVVVTALFFLPFENESAVPGIRTLVPVKVTEPAAARGNAESQQQLDDRARCRLLVDRYKLSPRESEVLAYVVKGRNAKHVAEKLYISESTAKTHISNIYRKTNVHSQQELLDVIDEL